MNKYKEQRRSFPTIKKGVFALLLVSLQDDFSGSRPFLLRARKVVMMAVELTNVNEK